LRRHNQSSADLPFHSFPPLFRWLMPGRDSDCAFAESTLGAFSKPLDGLPCRPRVTANTFRVENTQHLQVHRHDSARRPLFHPLQSFFGILGHPIPSQQHPRKFKN
jgi:hypothetical protein